MMKVPASFPLPKQSSDEVLHACRVLTQGSRSHKPGSRWQQTHGETAPRTVGQHIYQRATLCSGSDPAQMLRYLISEWPGQVIA